MNGPLGNSAAISEENKIKSVKLLAKRFAEKLSFQIFDPSKDTVDTNAI